MSEEILDWQEALPRVLNKRPLYIKLLNKFIESERGTPARVDEALKNGQKEEAKQLVHTTKGSAANLGAKALAAAALNLEMAIKTDVDVDVCLKRFEDAVTDALLAMTSFIDEG